MKDKNIFNWIISVLAIILVVVSAYFGFTQKGLNSGTLASRWSSQMVFLKSNVVVISEWPFLATCHHMVGLIPTVSV